MLEVTLGGHKGKHTVSLSEMLCKISANKIKFSFHITLLSCSVHTHTHSMLLNDVCGVVLALSFSELGGQGKTV